MEIVEFAKAELSKFNDIKIDPGPHVYYDSLGTSYTSVTTFVEKYSIPFDKYNKALGYALRSDQDVQTVLNDWEYKGSYARTLGTEIHSVMEHLWKNEENVPNYDKMKEYDGMTMDFEYRRTVCEDLYSKMKGTYIPIANEIIVNDAALGLAGTIDFVAYNTKTDTVDILDWKTSKQFSVSSGSQRMKDPFCAFPNSNVSHYSLQLSLYKYIVEKHTNLKIGELRLFQIPKKGKTKTIKCYDMVDLIKSKLFGIETTTDGVIEYVKK